MLVMSILNKSILKTTMIKINRNDKLLSKCDFFIERSISKVKILNKPIEKKDNVLEKLNLALHFNMTNFRTFIVQKKKYEHIAKRN